MTKGCWRTRWAGRGVILLFLGTPAVTQGQTAPEDMHGCEVFDSCALRVSYGLFRTSVVRGSEGAEVARIGLGNPPLDSLFARSGEATISFEHFRRDHTRASWMTVLGGIEIVGGLVARSRDNDNWAKGLTISGIVIEVAGMIFRSKADEHLSEAIWWYNRSLLDGSVR